MSDDVSALELMRAGDNLNASHVFKKIVTPLKASTRSSTLELGCLSLSLWIAWLGICVLTHKYTFPFFFGVTMSCETHGVYPSTFSMIPCCSSFVCFAETFFLKWNRFCKADWATGGTVLQCVTSPHGLKFPIPLEDTPLLLNQIWTLLILTYTRPRSLAVTKLRRDSCVPWSTWMVDMTCFPFALMLASNFPSRLNRLLYSFFQNFHIKSLSDAAANWKNPWKPEKWESVSL